MSTTEGNAVVVNGWKRSGILDAVTNDSASLPSIDPFQEIAPLPETESRNNDSILPLKTNQDFINTHHEDNSDDSDWGFDKDDFDRNAFDFIFDDGDN